MFFNPAQKLPILGHRLPNQQGDFEMLTKQLQPDEILFGLYDESLELLAPYLSSVDKMEQFESRARKHEISRIGYYAVKMTIAEQRCQLTPLTF